MTAKRPYRIDFMPVGNQEDADAFFDLVDERTPQGDLPTILLVHEPETKVSTMDELRNHISMLLDGREGIQAAVRNYVEQPRSPRRFSASIHVIVNAFDRSRKDIWMEIREAELDEDAQYREEFLTENRRY